MKTLKQLEQELSLEWQGVQLIKTTLAKSLALKAYYINYALYRKQRSWQLVLVDPAMA